MSTFHKIIIVVALAAALVVNLATGQVECQRCHEIVDPDVHYKVHQDPRAEKGYWDYDLKDR